MSNLLSGDEIASAKYLEVQLTVARREINNLRQQLKSLSCLQRNEYKNINEQLLTWQCEGCRNNQKSQIDYSESAAASPLTNLSLKYVGTITTNFPEKRGTPRQPSICSDTVCKLTLNQEVFTNPSHALEGLEEFSHVWILFHFHKNEAHAKAKVSPPRLNGVKTGVFATRSPHRPNPIGLSLVKIISVKGNCIYFSGVDMVDGTPVLDIKPYIPQYDSPLTLNLVEEKYDGALVIPSSNPEETNSGYQSVNESQGSSNEQQLELPLNSIRIMDGEENARRDDVLGAASSESSDLRSSIDELLYSRLSSRIGEREAPDGEEESSSAQTLNYVPLPATANNIRIPSWISQSPVSRLDVIFKERALNQLSQLGTEGEEKKNVITNVLKEDPRSVYLRERWRSHCYVFKISELYVSCKFNDTNQVVTVFRVSQNAESDGDD